MTSPASRTAIISLRKAPSSGVATRPHCGVRKACCIAIWGSKPDHTRFVHSGGDSWLLLSDQTVDLDGDFGLIVKPRDFIVPGPISLQMMLDILDQIA